MPDPRFLDTIRAFNRFYTNKLGLLARDYLETPYTLTEARLLYEIGARKRVSASELNRDLALDPAYLSRLVKKFREAGFLRSERDPADGRSQLLHVTAAGHAEYERLSRLSREHLAKELRDVDQTSRRALMEAMQTIRGILDPQDDRAAINLRPHRIGDMGWIVQTQAEAYARDYGWNEQFEALIAKVAGTFLEDFDPARERCWIAERHGQRLGSVILAKDSETTAKLRLLYLQPQARGLGVGRRLVEECIGFARTAGYKTLSLWTNDILESAIYLYRSTGFELVSEERHSMFGPSCIGQTWELDLEEAKGRTAPAEAALRGGAIIVLLGDQPGAVLAGKVDPEPAPGDGKP